MRSAVLLAALALVALAATAQAGSGTGDHFAEVRGVHFVGCDGTDPLGRFDCWAQAEASAGAGQGESACQTHRLDAPAVDARVVSAGPASPEAEACTHGDAAAGTVSGARFGVRSNPFPFTKP